jgi:hypothetical protein
MDANEKSFVHGTPTWRRWRHVKTKNYKFCSNRQINRELENGALKMTYLILAEKRRVPELDLGFAISATAVKSTKNFEKMKDTIKKIAENYGTNKIRYSLLVYGDRPTINIPFRNRPISVEELSRSLDTVSINGRRANLDMALQEAMRMFVNPRPTAKMVLVVIADKRSDSSRNDIKV